MWTGALGVFAALLALLAGAPHPSSPPASSGAPTQGVTTPAGSTTSTPAPPTPTTPTAPPAALPARTSVDEGEYYVRAGHMTLAAGSDELNVSNFGMDDHDLTVDDAAGNRIAQEYLPAGATTQMVVDLPAGTYKLYCSLYDGAHDQAGMHMTLTVK